MNLERDFQRIKKLPEQKTKENNVHDSYDDYVMNLSNVYIDENEEEDENENDELNEKICGGNHNKNEHNVSVNVEM